MATHSSILAWKIPWTEEPGELQSMGSLGSDMTLWLNHQHFWPSKPDALACCQILQAVEPDVGSELSLMWENLCNIIILQFVVFPPRGYGIWLYHKSTPPTSLIVVPSMSLAAENIFWSVSVFFNNSFSIDYCDCDGLVRGGVLMVFLLCHLDCFLKLRIFNRSLKSVWRQRVLHLKGILVYSMCLMTCLG